MASGTKAGKRRREDKTAGRALDEVDIDLEKLVPLLPHHVRIVRVLLLHPVPLHEGAGGVVRRHLDRLDPAGLVDVGQHGAAVAEVRDKQPVLGAVEVHRAGAGAGEEPALLRLLVRVRDVVRVQLRPRLLERRLGAAAALLQLRLELGEGALACEDTGYAWTWAGRGPNR